MKLQDTQDKMLRRGEKEFPSLESENVRASRVLGDQLASSPWVTDGRLRPRVGERLPKVTEPIWAELRPEPKQKCRQSSENIPILLDSLHSRERERERERERKDLFLGGCSNLEKIAIFSLPGLRNRALRPHGLPFFFKSWELRDSPLPFS